MTTLPDRELDRLVAEHALGWEVAYREWRWGGNPEIDWVRLFPASYEGGPQGFERIPNFTHDIGACFRDIIPAMEAEGWSWEMNGGPRFAPWCRFTQVPHFRAATDPNPTRAIVLAVLAALGVTTEQEAQR